MQNLAETLASKTVSFFALVKLKHIFSLCFRLTEKRRRCVPIILHQKEIKMNLINHHHRITDDSNTLCSIQT
ncbi:hypothetical protein C5167_040264 [Papaver somniferum]|uniref:Uncharacterized protein n=1 Tax=Papaver somniferum TaxID=3469 RepID=A0A4Y7IHX8_PAPSO|nr:hypothetical protein C5167_040264 [Papaver somniferum]